MAKVLSIDFDYFQNVDKELLSYYPDGNDLKPEISTIVWASRYLEKNSIKSISILKRELFMLNNLLEKQENIEAIKISHSHLDAYKFIQDYVPSGEKIHITNIDMHHDLFNGNDDLDCGNWLGKLSANPRNSISIEWIANPISKEMYGIEKNNKLNSIIKENVAELKGRQYDYVFLCRSDNWLPPHLDEEFEKLSNKMKEIAKKHNSIFLMNEDVIQKRDYNAAIEQIRKVLNN